MAIGSTSLVKSIFGRQLAVTSTGGIVSAYNENGTPSTAWYAAAVMRDANGTWLGSFYDPVSSHSSSGATMVEGFNFIASATAAAYAFSMPTPVAGLGVKIGIAASATTISFSGSATTILFGSTAIGGSTSMTVTSAGGAQGMFVTFRAVSTAYWAVESKTILGSTVLNGVS